MATLDRHPPLYFWALHTVHHWLGFHLWDGLLLTIGAGLGMLLLLIQLARKLSGNTTLALFIGVVYYLSPAVVQMDLEARNYPFLGLFALAGLLVGYPIAQGRASWPRILLFTLVNLCGFLTHYYYGFLLVPGLLFTLYRNGLGKAFAVHFGILVASVLLFLLVFPGLFEFLEVYAQEPAADPSRTMWIRIRVFIYGWMGFFTAWHPGKHIAFWLSATVLSVTLGRRSIRRKIGEALKAKDERAYHLWYLVWCMAFTTAFYMVAISPAPATGEQYFAYFWPHFTLFGVLLVATALPHRIGRAVAPIYLAGLVISFVLAVHASPYLRNVLPMDWYPRMAGSEVLVTDEKRRSHLPRISIHLPSELPIVVTNDPARSLRSMPEKDITMLERGAEIGPSLDPERLWPERSVKMWSDGFRHHRLIHYQR